MNPQRVVLAFKVWADGDAALHAALPAISAQSGADADPPRLVIGAKLKPFPGSATLARADVTFAVESHAGDATVGSTAAEDHETLVELLRTKLFGATDDTALAVRANVAAAVSASGHCELDARYLAVGEPAQEKDGDRFRTTLTLRGGVNLTAAA